MDWSAECESVVLVQSTELCRVRSVRAEYGEWYGIDGEVRMGRNTERGVKNR